MSSVGSPPSAAKNRMTLTGFVTRINAHLEQVLPHTELEPQKLHQAMRYAALGQGKRLRPLLVYASGVALQADLAVLDGCAAAVELIHAYSLVHDDLPAMDDDDLRRGKPSCHKAFDEATAILVGDALQSLAFEQLSTQTTLPAVQQCKMVACLAKAIGSRGMAGGQALDVAAVGRKPSTAEIETIHRLKTGALITVSVQLGCLAAESTGPNRFAQLTQFAHYLGLAFQIQDDILDIEGQTKTLGKQQGSDLANHKLTYPTLTGLDEAKRKVRELHQLALDTLTSLNLSVDLLQTLIKQMIRI